MWFGTQVKYSDLCERATIGMKLQRPGSGSRRGAIIAGAGAVAVAWPAAVLCCCRPDFGLWKKPLNFWVLARNFTRAATGLVQDQGPVREITGIITCSKQGAEREQQRIVAANERQEREESLQQNRGTSPAKWTTMIHSSEGGSHVTALGSVTSNNPLNSGPFFFWLEIYLISRFYPSLYVHIKFSYK